MRTGKRARELRETGKGRETGREKDMAIYASSYGRYANEWVEGRDSWGMNTGK